MARHESAERRRSCPTSFIGTFPDGPDQLLIVLRGDLDAVVLVRLAVHVKDALAARTRFLTIDAAAVTRCDPGLLDLLGRTQRRLARQHGLLTVRGLRPHLLDGVGPAARPVPGTTVGDPSAHGSQSSGAWSAVRRAS